MSKEPIIGMIKRRIMCDERTAISTVYVVRGSSVCNVQTKQCIQSLLEEHKDLFNGVGKLKDFQVKLHVSPDIMPVA